jgi:hypothetical protein
MALLLTSVCKNFSARYSKIADLQIMLLLTAELKRPLKACGWEKLLYRLNFLQKDNLEY